MNRAHNYYNNTSLNKWIQVAVVVGLLNLFSYNNLYFSVGIVAIKTLILFKCLLKGELIRYFSYWLIFLCSSFEFEHSTSTEVLYGFKEFEILGVSFSTWMLVPLLLSGLLNTPPLFIKRGTNVFSYARDTLLLGVMGLVNGLISILFNDNNVLSFQNVFKLLFANFYTQFIMEAVLILSFLIIVNYSRKRDCREIFEIDKVLVAILFGCVATMLVSKLTNIKGIYGGIETLSAQNVIRYVPFLYIYTINAKSTKEKLLGFVISTLGMYLTITYNATGKMIILYVIVAALVIVSEIKQYKVKNLFIILIFIISGFVLISSISSNMGQMLTIKIREVNSLFEIGSDWIQNMSASPRVRVAELINIITEYLHKPYRFLFGKGYLGTIVDHSGLLVNLGTGAYTTEQISLGIFYGVHESVALLLLYNGLFGLYFLTKYLYKLTYGITKSMNNMSGIFWLSMSYGFSFTLTGFGLVSLLLCLHQLDYKDKEVL